MICHMIGFSPISIIGFGFKWLSSLILVPNPPARITTFIGLPPYIPTVFFEDRKCFPASRFVILQRVLQCFV